MFADYAVHWAAGFYGRRGRKFPAGPECCSQLSRPASFFGSGIAGNAPAARHAPREFDVRVVIITERKAVIPNPFDCAQGKLL